MQVQVKGYYLLVLLVLLFPQQKAELQVPSFQGLITAAKVFNPRLQSHWRKLQ